MSACLVMKNPFSFFCKSAKLVRVCRQCILFEHSLRLKLPMSWARDQARGFKSAHDTPTTSGTSGPCLCVYDASSIKQPPFSPALISPLQYSEGKPDALALRGCTESTFGLDEARLPLGKFFPAPFFPLLHSFCPSRAKPSASLGAQWKLGCLWLPSGSPANCIKLPLFLYSPPLKTPNHIPWISDRWWKESNLIIWTHIFIHSCSLHVLSHLMTEIAFNLHFLHLCQILNG